MEQKHICKHCQSKNVIKKGIRITENRGKLQKFYCKDCQKYSTFNDGFYRMRNDPKKITKAIDLYFSSLSSRKVRNNFRRHEETNISHNSVLSWARKYSLLVNKYVSSLTPKLSGKCYADDTKVFVSKEMNYFWVNVDYESRFISATHYSVTSKWTEAREFINKTTKYGYPQFIQTDAAMFYPKVFKSLFSRKGRGKSIVEHRVTNARRTGKHNVRIETVFSKIKDRVRNFRGFKALWSAPILLNGLVLQHNYIECHTTTGKIPSEIASINLECGLNRWLGLIKLANQ